MDRRRTDSERREVGCGGGAMMNIWYLRQHRSKERKVMLRKHMQRLGVFFWSSWFLSIQNYPFMTYSMPQFHMATP
ncbi:hypothetical protein DL93DRAFT_339770 [Clavulina sp. PMI_390]|nr:hypothetical protein DL93DRAFT_339770 [Clavulina sp. PMI_390]